MAEMVAYNLGRQGLEVEVVSDGRLGLRRAREASTSLLIVDLMLPGLDGLQLAGDARRARPDLPILILTARGEEDVRLKGFESGADDFLTKPFSMEELIARVKALLRRWKHSSELPDVTDDLAFGDLRLATRDLRCWIAENEVELRPKEFGLLVALASEPGRLFTRLELAQRVWGYAYLANTRTIDTHVKNLRRKVEDRSAFTFLETVRGVGYRFRVRPKGGA